MKKDLFALFTDYKFCLHDVVQHTITKNKNRSDVICKWGMFCKSQKWIWRMEQEYNPFEGWTGERHDGKHISAAFWQVKITWYSSLLEIQMDISMPIFKGGIVIDCINFPCEVLLYRMAVEILSCSTASQCTTWIHCAVSGLLNCTSGTWWQSLQE